MREGGFNLIWILNQIPIGTYRFGVVDKRIVFIVAGALVKMINSAALISARRFGIGAARALKYQPLISDSIDLINHLIPRSTYVFCLHLFGEARHIVVIIFAAEGIIKMIGTTEAAVRGLVLDFL